MQIQQDASLSYQEEILKYMTLYNVIAVIWIRNRNESRIYLCTAKIKTTITDVDTIIESMIEDY